MKTYKEGDIVKLKKATHTTPKFRKGDIVKITYICGDYYSGERLTDGVEDGGFALEDCELVVMPIKSITYTLTQDTLFGKKGDTFEKSAITPLLYVGLKVNITAMDTTLLLHAGLLEEVNGDWKPKEGEQYWNVDSTGSIYVNTWRDDEMDTFCYNTGNVFKAKEEAYSHKQLMLAKGREIWKV